MDDLREDIIKKLRDIRLKLLDLSKRNRLLNFRHSKSCLSIVDEQPRQVFDYLVNQGKPMTFLALPEESDEEEAANENGDEAKFREAHTSAREIDLGDELPRPESIGEEPPEKHSDDKLQTKLFMPQLETRLRRMRSTARSVIEETGKNQLFLALGFLSWRDRADTSQSYDAPLILVPVELERGRLDRRERCYTYMIKYTGEDLIPNLSLREKLKKDDLILPDFEEEGLSENRVEEQLDPEAYFSAVNETISHMDGWEVKRRMVVGFFTFAKLLMYLDINPEVFADHALVRTLLGCGECSGADDLDLPDEDSEETDNIPLVMDADSSQTKAITRALSGHSMVIQGPPGTGKSQTITNLIACFLNVGKSVLFVAEKMAALNVVHRNLEKVGLSDLCLQLHSHKANKREVLDSLRRRVSKRWHSVKPGNDGSIERLRSLREALSEYVELLKKPVGPGGETIFEIFGKAESLRERRSESVDLSIDHLESLTQADIEHAKAQIEDLSPLVLELGPIRDQPWYGYKPVELLHGDQSQIVGHLEAVEAAAKNIQTSAQQLFAEIGIPDNDISLTCAEARSISALDPGEVPCDLLPDLGAVVLQSSEEEEWHEVGSFCSSVCKCRAQSEEVGKFLRDCALTASSSENNLSNAADTVKQHRIDSLDIAAAIELRNIGRRFTELIDQFYVLADSAIDAGLPKPRTVAEMRLFIRLNSLVEKRPQEVEPHIVDRLLDPSIRTLFTRMLEEGERLGETREYLGGIFALRDVCAPEDLATSRRTLRQAHGRLFRLLSSEYRHARRMVAGFVREPRRIRSANLGTQLEMLEDFLEQEAGFSTNREYTATFADLFRGLETNWDRLRMTVTWITNLCRACASLDQARTLACLEARSHGTWPLTSELTQVVTAVERELRRYVEATNLSGEATLHKLEDQPVHALRQGVTDIVEAITTIERSTVPGILESDQSMSDIVRAIELQAEYRDLRERIERNDAARSLLGSHFQGAETDIEAVTTTVEWSLSIRRAGLPKAIVDVISSTTPRNVLATVSKNAHNWQQDLNAIASNIEGLRQFGELNLVTFLGSSVESLLLNQLETRMRRVVAEMDSLMRWADYCRAAKRARDMGLSTVVDLIEKGELPPEKAVDTYLYTIYDRLVRKLLRENPRLATFTRAEYEAKRATFAELDKSLLQLWQQRIASRASERRVPAGTRGLKVRDFTEMCLLEREFSKRMRHLPIRRLLDRAGGAIGGLKPVFMMSPMSVAQFLEQGKHSFDVVIMDEASQIQPHDALGAIARSQQMVVVGDSKQLPPTTFFQSDMSNLEDEQGEESIFDDQDVDSSILDVCEGVKLPSARLKWHYRSEHESLIAFSNVHWYDGELIVFPSSGSSSQELGIDFHYVEDATYTSGRNTVEAEQVARAIIQHARISPGLSLGVGTFNLRQRELIEDWLTRLVKEDPTAEMAVAKLNEVYDGTEPLFIKNLENLQGDERDVIFISCTFGPDKATGQVYQRFGPVNGRNGPRRLNVLFTRAKKRMEVFSSMTLDQVVVEPGAEGRVALKGFLEYAETGRLPDYGRITDRPPDSDFEIAVAQVLKNLGYQVEPQVGVAGYWVDVGVYNPRRPAEFILGVECDGAAYHSSRFARDRDRLREEVLKRRGWRIYRVWSTDWFRNRGPEIERLKTTLEELVEQSTPTVVEVTNLEEATPEAVETVVSSLTDDDLKRQLFIFCRENIPRSAEVQKIDGFLHPVVLDALVTRRITNRSDFRKYVPGRIRGEMNSDDLQYLDDIFEIIESAS